MMSALAISAPLKRAADQFSSGRSTISLNDKQRTILTELMQAVRKTTTPGRYHGAFMTLERALLAAEMSGDWNPVHVDPDNPHPLFNKGIAHGMDTTITQGLAAMRLEINGAKLVPKTMSISFLWPVFLGEDRIEIVVETPTNTPFQRDITLYATNSVTTAKKRVATIHVDLVWDRFFDEDSWFCSIMSAWRISALLAETWPGCLYVAQELRFNRPMVGQKLGTFVRGEGKNRNGRYMVCTRAYDLENNANPSIEGQATILVPAA